MPLETNRSFARKALLVSAGTCVGAALAFLVLAGRGGGMAASLAAGTAKGKGNNVPRYAGTVVAPEFPAGIPWVNTDKPVFLRDLRGKIVILDFWTYC